MTDSLRLALTLLTVARVRSPERVNRHTAGRAMMWAPAIGVLLGIAAAAVVFVLRLLLHERGGPLLPAVGGIATLAGLSRCLHLDGLADVADGLGAGPDRARSLAVMKTPQVGAFGLVAVVVVLLGQVAALSVAVDDHRGTVSLVLAVTLGRLAATLACTPGTPPARREGLGALVAGTVAVKAAIELTLAATAFAFLAGRFDLDGGDLAEAGQALAAVAVGVTVGWLVRRWLVHRLGGITGDVLGTLVEVTTLAVLVTMVCHVPVRVERWLGLV